ncbi:zinc metalloproteinase-disintegrin-like MTP9 [Rhipicephalus microplus]|uniref:zinc metalloproteinase-disintegrin-like MTP9 n=1 Tax=Rhipicephalus microplus TaxID=6941 RepID=UPI003F6B6D41
MLAKTLDQLNLFVQTQKLFKEDDAVVLFTGLDVGVLYTNPPSLYTGIVGLAEVRAACGSKKAAVVEDLPRTFTAAHTFVHEVGHLLGSEHDGASLPPDSPSRVDPKICSAYEKHIMSPRLGTGMKQEFSWCSAVQIAAYLL